MKKTLLLTSILLASSAFADANQSPSAPTPNHNQQNFVQSILHNVIERDTAQVIKASQALKTALQTNKDPVRSEKVCQAFDELIRSWKMVQTAYVAGELDTDMLDTPRLIDAYHDGKENLQTQLERALKSGDEAKVALFKNTFKSITALEFYLYADKELSKTERDYAIYTLDTLIKHFKDIENTYKKHEKDFTGDSDVAMSHVLNALIDSSYKMKEWRVGDPAGLSRKYKDEPDNKHQEYPYSQESLTALEAILSIHADMMAERPYPNLGNEAIKQGAQEEVELIRQLIAKAQKQVQDLQKGFGVNKQACHKDNAVDFASPDMKPLYQTLGDLNDAYYQSLVKALPVQAKILDADGD